MRLSWGCDNIKAKNIFILSQTEPLEILVHMAIPTRTAYARGYSHAHKTLILVYISVRVAIATLTCAWLSHAHVYSIQICSLALLSELQNLFKIISNPIILYSTARHLEIKSTFFLVYYRTTSRLLQ